MRWTIWDRCRMVGLVRRWFTVSILAAILLIAVPGAWARTYVRVQAPDVRVETHDERQGYVWQSGYWHWRGHQHQWRSGHYARERRNRAWSDGRWEHTDRGYYWVGGHWARR